MGARTGWLDRRGAARYGWPYLVILDLGPEFIGGPFQNMPGTRGVVGHVVDAQSPRRSGRAERPARRPSRFSRS